MAENSSEEKNLPASPKKLRDLRDKGQIPISKEFISISALFGAITYLYIMLNSILLQIRNMFSYSFDSSAHANQNLSNSLTIMETLTLQTIFPVIACAAIAALAGYFYNAGGFILNFEALTPKFDKLNPAEGLKNMFSMDSLVALGKGLIKSLFICAVFYVIFKTVINSFFWSSICGESCTVGALRNLIFQTMVYGLAVLGIAGFLDIFITKLMFLKKHKMSITERKKEMKDDFGAPEIRKARNELRQALLNSPNIRGIEKATFAIYSDEAIVAISYVQGKTVAPVTVAKARYDQTQKLLDDVRRLNIKLYREADLANRLCGPAQVGEYIPQGFFNEVAAILVREHMVR